MKNKEKKESKFKKNFKYVVLTVVLFIPFIYSFFYLKAYWNPYGKGNIDNLPVAIVNEDKGSQGKELIKQIKEADTLKLIETTEDKATDGLYDEKYYAVITIPEDFTSSIESINSTKKTHPTITYSPNQKYNYLSSQIIDRVVSTVETNLDNTINSEVVGNLSENLKTVPDQLQTVSNGFETLNEGTNQLANGSNELASGSNKLANGSNTLNSSYQAFDKGVSDIKSGSNQLNSSMQTLNNGINTLANSTSDLNNLKNSIPTLTGSISSLKSGSDELTTDLNSYVAGVNKIIEANEAPITSALAQYDKYNSPKDDTYNALQKQYKQLEYLKSVGSQLQTGNTKLNTGLSKLNSSTQSLNVLPSKIDQLNSGIQAIQSGSNQITAGVSRLDNGINTLFESSAQVKSGINTLATGATTLNNGMTTLNNGISTLNNSVTSANNELSNKLTETKKEVKKVNGLKNYSKNAVKINKKVVDEIPSYGTAFSPLFISIGLWVGALMMFIVLYYDKENRFKSFSIESKHHLKRTLCYHIMATLAAIVLAFLLQVLLDFKITSVPLYYLVIILTSNTFMAIIEFLIVNFKDIGKFIALIVLILQLAASAGTFPIETVTKGFRWLNGLLPMTYTIRLLKEPLMKIESSLLTKNLIIVICICAVFVGINITLDIIKEKKELSKLKCTL